MRRWERRHLRESLGDDLSCYGVYRGERSMSCGDVRVLPVDDYLQALWNGDILT